MSDVSSPTPVLKNNKIYKDGKLKKWFKRTISFSICAVIIGVGIGGIAVGTSRPNIYLEKIELANPYLDPDFNLRIVFQATPNAHGQHPAVIGSTHHALSYQYSFNDGNQKHWDDAGYSVDWTFVPASVEEEMPDGLWIEKANKDEFGWIKWDGRLTLEDLEDISPDYTEPFQLSIFAYGPGGAKTGSGQSTLSDWKTFDFFDRTSRDNNAN
ncbi:MAG: hypothetical protein LBT17_02250 [Mycoplasmataceae bacterium]|nr:hypothetical protein [Mycoplasmataceae bacterium]